MNIILDNYENNSSFMAPSVIKTFSVRRSIYTSAEATNLGVRNAPMMQIEVAGNTVTVDAREMRAIADMFCRHVD